VRTNFNRAIGWGLLLAGLAWAARVDAWSLGEPSLSGGAVAARVLVRHSLVVLFLHGLLQLLVARLAQRPQTPSATLALGCRLTAASAIAWGAGTVGGAFFLGALWLLPVAGAAGLAGYLLLWSSLDRIGLNEPIPITLPRLLPVICLGLALDAVMAAATVLPASGLAGWFGPADGLRLRMLRLGRVASAALPVLAFLYEQAAPSEASPRARVIGRWGHFVGAVGMPLLLFASAAVSFDLKYLLPLPVGAVVVGTWIAAWQAWRSGRMFAAGSWLLTALSMAVGQWMGAFAFDGPFAAPAFLGGYSDFARHLVRAAHTNGIVFGMIGIYAVAEVEAAPTPRRRFGLGLFAAGVVAALATETLRAGGAVPAAWLAVGPAIAAAGLALVVLPLAGSPGNSK